ncbi:MAG: TIGR02281 family clan AA aspartic protease [Gammaproteobacteria bacterium]|nr:TIGR02281 family clan AA aspartic protease [Gammaproteobacteria bacterium]
MRRQPDPTQTPYHLGRGMLLLGWVAGLGLLSLLFSDILEQQRNPNARLDTVQTADGSREVELQRNRHGHYLARGTINGQAVEFLLDTGASDVSIPEAVARRVGLRRGTPRLYETANGTITAYTTLLDTLALGEIALQRVRASINPQMEGETILLGMSALKQLEFTQRGDTLIIRQ